MEEQEKPLLYPWMEDLRRDHPDLKITFATREDLPDPEYTLPPRRGWIMGGLHALKRRLARRRAGGVEHAPVP